MVFLVPFDGSGPARTALDRAVTYGHALDEDVLAVALMPTGAAFAPRRTWIDPGDDFAAESAIQELRRKIEEATDDAELEFTDATPQSPAGGISAQVRRIAGEVDASVVFLGGDGDGDVNVPLDGNAAGDDFDVHVVRRLD